MNLSINSISGHYFQIWRKNIGSLFDADMIKKAVDGASQFFVALYFSYTYVGGTSAYGTISQYDEKNDTFIHRDMWLD